MEFKKGQVMLRLHATTNPEARLGACMVKWTKKAVMYTEIANCLGQMLQSSSKLFF